MKRRLFLGSSAAALLAGNTGPWAGTPPAYPRRASDSQTRSIHSGHSLTDSYVWTGPWPGAFFTLISRLHARGYEFGLTVSKSTIPGSPLHWRWNHQIELSYPEGSQADARHDIALFDCLVLTEGGPPPRPHVQPQVMAESLDYLMRFAANAIENGDHGKGLRDIILWSIWPSLDGMPDVPEWADLGGFRDCLPEYGRSFRFMADFASWKLRQIYPQLPDDWRIWIFPGHLMMERIWDDIQAGQVPGISDISELFADDIHPNSVAGYALACLVYTCMYQEDLRTRRRVYVQPAFEDTHQNRSFPAATHEQAEYFWRISWEIATSYEPAGMGGTRDAEPAFDPEKDLDYWPDWTLADPGRMVLPG